MRWLGRLIPLTILVALVVGLGFAISQWGGDHGVIETVTTTADGETVITREGGRDFPGFFFFPFAFFGLILFWFLFMGLMKAMFFGFRGGGGHGPGGWDRGYPNGEWRRGGRQRWEERARAIHDEWHAGNDHPAPGSSGHPEADPGGAA